MLFITSSLLEIISEGTKKISLLLRVIAILEDSNYTPH